MGEFSPTTCRHICLTPIVDARSRHARQVSGAAPCCWLLVMQSFVRTHGRVCPLSPARPRPLTLAHPCCQLDVERSAWRTTQNNSDLLLLPILLLSPQCRHRPLSLPLIVDVMTSSFSPCLLLAVLALCIDCSWAGTSTVRLLPCPAAGGAAAYVLAAAPRPALAAT